VGRYIRAGAIRVRGRDWEGIDTEGGRGKCGKENHSALHVGLLAVPHKNVLRASFGIERGAACCATQEGAPHFV